MHYSQNRKRITFKDGILYRQNYNGVGNISLQQVILPVQLLATLLKSLHGTASKHPGIIQMMQENDAITTFHQLPTRTSLGTTTRNMHQRLTNQCMKLRPDRRNVPEWEMGRRDACHSNRITCRTTTQWKLQNYCHSNQRILKIRFCIPSLYPHCSKDRSHERYHKKTRVSTHTINCRQRISFRISSI